MQNLFHAKINPHIVEPSQKKSLCLASTIKLFILFWKVSLNSCTISLIFFCEIKSNLLNHVPYVLACQHGLHANVRACQHGLHANLVYACQLFIFTCQCIIRHANVSSWHANLPNSMQIFNLACQHAKEHTNFSNIPLMKC